MAVLQVPRLEALGLPNLQMVVEDEHMMALDRESVKFTCLSKPKPTERRRKTVGLLPNRGLYVSYDERTYGRISDVVKLSKTHGCVTWYDTFWLNPRNMQCPTDIIVRLKGKEKYFRGVLLAVASTQGFLVQAENNHRPERWRLNNERHEGDARVALFIHGLLALPKKPVELGKLRDPQHPAFFPLDESRRQILGRLNEIANP